MLDLQEHRPHVAIMLQEADVRSRQKRRGGAAPAEHSADPGRLRPSEDARQASAHTSWRDARGLHVQELFPSPEQRRERHDCSETPADGQPNRGPKILETIGHVVPITSGRHFNGANAFQKENYETCFARLQDKKTRALVACGWSVAEVVPPLHAVCKVTGTVEAPKRDVCFTAGRAVVVPHGHVENLLRNVKLLMQYDRQGDLFVAKLTMFGFTGQGAKD